jgi:starvation-inducible DNA-binding protein
MDREGHPMTSPTYLILGATGGMGQAVCERLSKRDASLLIGGRDPARLEALSKCTGTGALAGDARAPLAVERAVARTVEHFGRIDGAVNLVGSLLLKPAHLTKPEEWDDVIAANPGCAFPLVRAAAFAGATHEPTAQARPFRESGTASLRPHLQPLTSAGIMSSHEHVVEALSRVRADTYTLFETQSTEYALVVDEIAERIRAIGARAPGSYTEVAELASLKEGRGFPPAMEMIGKLFADQEATVASARKIVEVAEAAGDRATADLGVRRIKIHEKKAWMLRSHLE